MEIEDCKENLHPIMFLKFQMLILRQSCKSLIIYCIRQGPSCCDDWLPTQEPVSRLSCQNSNTVTSEFILLVCINIVRFTVFVIVKTGSFEVLLRSSLGILRGEDSCGVDRFVLYIGKLCNLIGDFQNLEENY